MMRGFGMEQPQAQIQGDESHDERVWDGATSGSDTWGMRVMMRGVGMEQPPAQIQGDESHDERVWDGATSGSDTGG